MNTKLTLRLDDRLIARAKAHADASGRSVSQMVAEYFALIDSAEYSPGTPPPRVASLRGRLKGARTDEADHRRHLENKHR